MHVFHGRAILLVYSLGPEASLVPCGGGLCGSGKEDTLCMNVRGWLHLGITGFQGPEAKPFKAGHDFAAVNAVKRSRDAGYGSAALAQI